MRIKIKKEMIMETRIGNDSSFQSVKDWKEFTKKGEYYTLPTVADIATKAHTGNTTKII